MLRVNDIDVEYDEDLFELSPLVVRKTRDYGENDSFVFYPELQFQVKNVSGTQVNELKAEATYFDIQGKFVGVDSDIRLEAIPRDHTETFSLFIDAPERTHRATLSITGKRFGLMESVILPYGLLALVTVLILACWL